MKKLRDKFVLIIDDDTGMLRALDKVLTGAGAVVSRAECAGDAVEILTARKEKFDLVITDLRMPFVTGLTVVYAIHKIHPDLPVIVLTAFGSADVKEECFRQGAVDFLEKPLDASELFAAIDRVFTSRKSGSGAGGMEDGKNKEDLISADSETNKNRQNAGFPAPGKRDCDRRSGAGGADMRKEQIYGYQSQYSPNPIQ